MASEIQSSGLQADHRRLDVSGSKKPCSLGLWPQGTLLCERSAAFSGPEPLGEQAGFCLLPGEAWTRASHARGTCIQPTLIIMRLTLYQIPNMLYCYQQLILVLYVS